MEIEPLNWIQATSAKNVIVVLMLIVLWIGESLAPMFVGRTYRVRHGIKNILVGVLNAVVGNVVFSVVALTAMEWSRLNSFGIVHHLPRSVPVWISAAVGLILMDLWMYAWHRLNHRVPFLWRFHAWHHSDRELDATSAVRFHTGEIFLSGAARLLVLPLLGITPSLLLVYESILLPVILVHHSNVRVGRRVDSFFRTLLVTPWMHWVHHSQVREETNSNFGSVLSVWDRLFQSFRLRQHPEKIHLGLSETPGSQTAP